MVVVNNLDDPDLYLYIDLKVVGGGADGSRQQPWPLPCNLWLDLKVVGGGDESRRQQPWPWPLILALIWKKLEEKLKVVVNNLDDPDLYLNIDLKEAEAGAEGSGQQLWPWPLS